MATADELDWDDLRYFLSAARKKTLAGAARSLGVEHTTIGRRLSALERRLGAVLFHRGPEGLTLTELGQQIAPLVEDVERTVVRVRELVATRAARVRLAVPSGFTPLFASRLAELAREHPGLSLEIVSGSALVDLGRQQADLAIRSGAITDHALVVRKLCESGFSLYASPAYLARHPGRFDPEDLTGHELIGYDPSLAALPAATWLEQRAASATVVLRSREMTDMLAAASSGAGLAVLPCMLADPDPTLCRLTPGIVASRTLSLVYRREERLSEHVRAVARFVVSVVAAHAERIRGVTPAGAGHA